MSETMKCERRSILEPALKELTADMSDARVHLHEVPFQGQFIVRALEPLEALNEKLEPVLGTPLSDKPNEVIAAGDTKIFWVRDGQWQIVTSAAARDDMLQNIETALQDSESSVVDVSDGHTMLRLSGEKARDVLMKGCPLDIHPRAFPAGAMARTRLVHSDILLHRAEDEAFDLYIRTSYAEYVLRWLYDAALEYGIHIQQGEKQ